MTRPATPTRPRPRTSSRSTSSGADDPTPAFVSLLPRNGLAASGRFGRLGMRAIKTAAVLAVAAAVLGAGYLGSGAVVIEPKAAGSMATASAVTVTRSADTLTIVGDEGTNRIFVSYATGVGEDVVRVTVSTDGETLAEFYEPAPGTITKVSASLMGGSDELLVNGPFSVSLDLGAGEDVAKRAELFERFTAGPGNDFIKGIEVEAGPGVLAGPGRDRVIGNEFDDKLFGGPGQDTLIGKQGDDLLNGGGGRDVCKGGGNFDMNQIRNAPDKAPRCEVKSEIP